MTETLIIGISCALIKPDKTRQIFNGRSLCAIEESLAHYLRREDTLPMLIPTGPSLDSMASYASHIDGLVLHGGEDIAPEVYGETARKDEWRGQLTKDRMELALIRSCLKQNIPILGICRGAQLINVALGGTLHQDIGEAFQSATCHRNGEIYEKNTHEMIISPKGHLAKIYPHEETVKINSVHHQAMKELGSGIKIEAQSSGDQIIEAISLSQKNMRTPLCLGVQWHPEFQDPDDTTLLDATPLLDYFIDTILERKKSC